jgi:hypothetical protein
MLGIDGLQNGVEAIEILIRVAESHEPLESLKAE